MAQPGYDTDRPQPGDAAPKISAQRARQGQNIKGMVMVLIVSVVLVVAAYAVMLAVQQEPSAVVNESANSAASAPVQQQFSPADQTAPQTTPAPAQPQQ